MVFVSETAKKFWEEVRTGKRPAPRRGTGGPKPKTIEARFWSKVDKNGPSHPVHGQCWLFVSGHGSSKKNRSKSYGSIQTAAKNLATDIEGLKNEYAAHRISWVIHFGPIPENFQVLHKCDVRRCVNPSHLFLGDHDKNMADMVEKSRSLKGEKQPIHKLTEKDVLEIRRLYAAGGISQSKLGEMFGVNQTNIGFIIRRVSWTHL